MEKELRNTVTIIGAGATGLAIGSELLSIGVDFLLVDQGEPGMGSTCHSAGVLHSGARYALTDPDLAEACRNSQQLFLSVAPFAVINNHEAYYLITNNESEKYAQDLTSACTRLNLPIRYVSRIEIRDSEPHVRIECEGALAVQDITIDPFLLVSSYVEELTDAGTQIIQFAEIRSATWQHDSWKLRIFEPLTNRYQDVVSKVVVIAAGPWTGAVLNRFGISLNLKYINGCMFVLKNNLVNRIITLCQPPTSCDSLIPCYSNTLLGSTWTEQSIADPTPPVLADESQAISALSRLLGNSNSHLLSHAYSGVRVLLTSDSQSLAVVSRRSKRGTYLIDHLQLNAVSNLVSIFGGKLTFHHDMARQATKLICQKIGRPYRSHNRTASMKIPRQMPRRHLASPRS